MSASTTIHISTVRCGGLGSHPCAIGDHDHCTGIVASPARTRTGAVRPGHITLRPCDCHVCDHRPTVADLEDTKNRIAARTPCNQT